MLKVICYFVPLIIIVSWLVSRCIWLSLYSNTRSLALYKSYGHFLFFYSSVNLFINFRNIKFLYVSLFIIAVYYIFLIFIYNIKRFFKPFVIALNLSRSCKRLFRSLFSDSFISLALYFAYTCYLFRKTFVVFFRVFILILYFNFLHFDNFKYNLSMFWINVE